MKKPKTPSAWYPRYSKTVPLLIILALLMVPFLSSCSHVRTFFGHQPAENSFSLSSQGLSQQELQNFQSSLKPINGEIRAKYDLARHFQKSNRHLNAVEELNGVIKLAPDFAQAYNALGVSYDMLGKYHMAEKCYKMAMHLNPDSGYVANNLGYSYMLQGKYQEAHKYMTMAVAMEKDNLRYHNNLNRLREWMKNAGQEPVLYAAEQKDPVTDVSVLDDSVKEAAATPETFDVEVSLTGQGAKASIIIEEDLTEIDLTSPSWPSGLIKNEESERSIKFYKISPVVPDENQEAGKNAVILALNEVNEEKPLQSGVAAETARKEKRRAMEKPPLIDIEVELINGNGIRGFAKRTGVYLNEKGYRIRNLKNADHFNYPETRIFYREDRKAEAELLAEKLPGNTRISADNMVHHREHFIKVLLGKDLAFPGAESGQTYRLEISNGNGVTGAAKRMSQYLKTKGFITGRLTNADHFNHESSRIFYGKDQLKNAQALVESLPDGKKAELVDTNGGGNGIRLVLGMDMR
jgi:tetratricopeptide (TPR) repeat protein